jgi:hypothetical protein
MGKSDTHLSTRFVDDRTECERRQELANRIAARKAVRMETEMEKRRRLQAEIDAIQWPCAGVSAAEKRAIMERIKHQGHGWYGGSKARG